MTNKHRIVDIQATLNSLLYNVELPKTNNAPTQTALLHFYVASMMESIGSSAKKKLVKAFKEKYDVASIMPGSSETLQTVAPFTLTCSVTNPRKQFDKAQFIAKISAEYEISRTELEAIASQCHSNTAAPMSFKVSTD